MITRLDQPDGSVLGSSVTGDVTKEDCEVMVPAVERAISDFGTINLLIDPYAKEAKYFEQMNPAWAWAKPQSTDEPPTVVLDAMIHGPRGS